MCAEGSCALSAGLCVRGPQEEEDLLSARIASLRDLQQRLSAALERGEVSKEDNDKARDSYKETTRELLKAVLRRQAFQRSAGFARYESLRRLRVVAADGAEVLAAADAADRLADIHDALAHVKVKREEQCCAQQALRRPLAACNTLVHADRPEKKRRRLTPHPRAGKAAVAAAGGAVQALLDEPTPRCDEEEEITAHGEPVYSSDDDDTSSDIYSDTD